MPSVDVTGEHARSPGEEDGPVELKITQDFGSGPVENSILVKRFIMLSADFTILKVSNSGGTAVNMMISLAGTRPAVGAGPGLF